tara:strand:- start:190 stop:1218 length:1029 start_codon:yes stop_codon:yes gene_type:complete
MNVAQRGTSSTSDSYATVDRFKKDTGGSDEPITQAQVDVASGTTPYTLGFTKALKYTNGNQTSGAGATDYIQIGYSPEAQDIRNSGWNYLSSSSYITLSFWAKASVAQTYQVRISSKDGTSQGFVFEYALSADTWTKITKTIPGNSNLQFDNDTGPGLEITFLMFIGTTYTSADPTLDAWGTYSYLTSRKDMTSTWWTTNDATFELTGVKLEVGSVATDFEHRSYAQELELCKRYFQVLVDDGSPKSFGNGTCYSSSNMHLIVPLSPEMRATPTLDYTTGSNYYRMFRDNSEDDFDSFNLEAPSHKRAVDLFATGGASGVQAASALLRTNNSDAKIRFSAEI